MEKILEKLMAELYSAESNILYIGPDILQKINITNNELQNILSTPSIHENYIEGLDLCSTGYIRIKLLPKGIYYIKEQRKPLYKKIIPHFQNLSGFYTVLISFFALICSIIAIIISLLK